MIDYGHGNFGQRGYFDPTSNYGSGQAPDAYLSAPVMDYYFNNDPEAAWTRYAYEMGWTPDTGIGKFAVSQTPRIMDALRAAYTTNPNLKAYDFMKGIDLQGQYNALSAQQRGESPQQFSPRTRTIARGF